MLNLINDQLTVTVKELGAELASILDSKTLTEYLWNGEASIWGRHAPILFPIVGKVKDNTYQSGGKTYCLPQHGFARDMDFEVVKESKNKIVLCLVDNEKTLEKYPYKFGLEVTYELEGRKLTVTYKVTNQQDSKIYFSIGAHPGFTCPVHEGEKYEDYYLEFSKPETLGISLLKDGLVSPEETPFLKNETKIPLSYELFKNDALVFKKYQSDYISLKHKDKGEVFKFYFAGYPFLGIWSKPGPFVCIEPWYGVADFTNHNGVLEDKVGIQSLEVGASFQCVWAVEFA
ncbi:MAG TPA: aldose 1-epimerase family protein [Cytophagaceae bacterium]|nr:aldose 1-epimerase family protein [Cytophagaceae bacterium]